jgi:DNA polymerase-3 subunit alpha/error-prone DNA polymerase
LLTSNNSSKDQKELFTQASSPLLNSPPPLIPHKAKTKTTDADLWNEYQALGFLRKTHPLALWEDAVLSVTNRVKALHLDRYIGRSVKLIGWPVTQKDVWTKDGLTMAFLSLEDETALYETVIFPQVYDRYSKLLFDQRPLLVYGHVANDEGAVSVEISRIELLEKEREGKTIVLELSKV